MITYKELRWGDIFSYGPENKIRLDQSPLTQLVGKNGHGKSSIALILEEVQFNTNSKGIKKANILNRYSKSKSYWIELDFDKDGNSYNIRTTRTGATSSIVLLCNGVDISNHTATGTFKNIENILGYNHTTFSQIVYQSSVSSLEFLTATDTARKKFLIELLNLNHYTRANEVFKALASDTSKRLEATSAKLATVDGWLKKYEKEPLDLIDLVVEPEVPADLQTEVTALEVQLGAIDDTNKKIRQNNKYKELLDAVIVPAWETGRVPPSRTKFNEISLKLADVQKKLKEGATLSTKCKGPTIKCPTCSQDMDNSVMFNMSQEFEANKASLEIEVADYKKFIAEFEALDKAYNAYTKSLAEYEKYHALYDPTESIALLDPKRIAEQVVNLEATINSINTAIVKARKHNKTAEEHNTKVKLIKSQLEEMHAERATYASQVITLTEELADLQVLVKSFSTTGLVAYKIECLVKDLEELTNEYLADLAGGRFQISFQIASSDKLNVVITDNGRDIDINALSSGERARVNVASLLAIRKLMQSLSNSRTNLLILDETVENLDAEGKEKLIEVLLGEGKLNTFLISHGFSHPLLEKLHVVKTNNISSIEDGS